MNRGTVMELGKRTAVVLTPEGRFIRVRKRSDYTVGAEIAFVDRTVRRRRGRLVQMSSVASAMAVCFAALWLFQAPPVVAYVSMDVNPSIELGLDAQERVQELRAVNEDAKALIEGMDYEGQALSEVMGELADRLAANHKLTPSDSGIVIASVPLRLLDVEWERHVWDTMTTILRDAAGRTLQGDAIAANLSVTTVSLPVEIRTEAEARGISSGKMAFWLVAESQGFELSLETLKAEPLEEIAAAWGGVDKVMSAAPKIKDGKGKKGKGSERTEAAAPSGTQDEPKTGNAGKTGKASSGTGPSATPSDEGNKGTTAAPGKGRGADGNSGAANASPSGQGQRAWGSWLPRPDNSGDGGTKTDSVQSGKAGNNGQSGQTGGGKDADNRSRDRDSLTGSRDGRPQSWIGLLSRAKNEEKKERQSGNGKSNGNGQGQDRGNGNGSSDRSNGDGNGNAAERGNDRGNGNGNGNTAERGNDRGNGNMAERGNDRGNGNGNGNTAERGNDRGNGNGNGNTAERGNDRGNGNGNGSTAERGNDRGNGTGREDSRDSENRPASERSTGNGRGNDSGGRQSADRGKESGRNGNPDSGYGDGRGSVAQRKYDKREQSSVNGPENPVRQAGGSSALANSGRVVKDAKQSTGSERKDQGTKRQVGSERKDQGTRQQVGLERRGQGTKQQVGSERKGQGTKQQVGSERKDKGTKQQAGSERKDQGTKQQFGSEREAADAKQQVGWSRTSSKRGYGSKQQGYDWRPGTDLERQKPKIVDRYLLSPWEWSFGKENGDARQV